jgi:hypothetical protein
MDYVRGCIFLHVSTLGQTYTANNGKLAFDVYRWGLPTTVWGNTIPTIANSEYTIEYEYTVLNKTIYTNLLGVYPNLYIASFQVNLDNSATLANTYNGFPFTLSFYWTSFNGLTQLTYQGAPNFDPTVSIDVDYQFDKQYNTTISNLAFQAQFPTVGMTLRTGGSDTLPKGSRNQLLTFTARITGQMNLAYSKTFVTLAVWY